MAPDLMAQIWLGVSGLILAVLAGLTGLVVWLFRKAPEWIERSIEERLSHTNDALARNTAMTSQVRDAIAVRNEAQKYRSAYERAALLIRKLNDIPEARPYIDQAGKAMRAVEHDAAWADLERRLLEDPAH